MFLEGVARKTEISLKNPTDWGGVAFGKKMN